jgi:uncharacterized protein (DUF302 family)
MSEKGVEFRPDCTVYEVSNPHQAKQAFEANCTASTALPCRISVYGTPGAYNIATILPPEIVKLSGSDTVEDVARGVDQDIITRVNT